MKAKFNDQEIVYKKKVADLSEKIDVLQSELMESTNNLSIVIATTPRQNEPNYDHLTN